MENQNGVEESQGSAPRAETLTFDPPKKKLHLQPKTQAALIEVLERRRMRLSPNYKGVALRHGISWRSLKLAWSKFDSGLIELGHPTEPEDIAVDAQTELKRTLCSLAVLERLLNDSLAALIVRAQQYMARGKLLAYRDMGIPLILHDLKTLSQLRNIKEEGFMAILQKSLQEKDAKAAVADVPSEKIETHSENQRAREALRRRLEERSTLVDAKPAEEVSGG